MELLEIPQLMDTCMRNGNHDDALALRSLLAKLAFLHSDVQVTGWDAAVPSLYMVQVFST